MAHGDFDLYYSDEPFSMMDKNQRTWLDPDLVEIWRQRSVFRPLITFTKNLGDVRATSMTVTQVLDPHPDTTALAARQIWMPSMHLDSRSREVTFQHNGNKIAYHKYDDMITYWKQNGQAGMRAIARGALGQSEVDMNDLLARNALIAGSLTTGYVLYSGSSATNFNGLGITDKFDPYVGADIWLGMMNRGVPGAMSPSGAGGSIVCFTSPGVIYDIQQNAGWLAVNQYLQETALLNYEVGSFKNVRYVQTPKCTLWNCGTVAVRYPVSAAINAGDGAPPPGTTKVDGTYRVGQTTGAIVNYIQLGTATTGSISDIKVNEIITIHAAVTNAYGVTNGVNFEEGKLTNRRVVAVDIPNKRLVLDIPVLVDFNVDLGAGVYAYVTKGRNIHASIFVGGPQAIVSGVAQAPQFYALDPIDDFKAIYRFSYDQYMGYAPWQPEVFEVVFSAGTTRIKGPKTVQ
jgi:N4-gp56 family major capsid protein